MERAKTFYSTLFSNWVFFSPPGAPKSIAPFNIPGSPVMGALVLSSSDGQDKAGEGQDGEGRKEGEGKKGITTYFLVEDVDKTLGAVGGAGGVVVVEKFVEGGHTEMGRFRDSEGNEVGVLKWLF